MSSITTFACLFLVGYAALTGLSTSAWACPPAGYGAAKGYVGGFRGNGYGYGAYGVKGGFVKGPLVGQPNVAPKTVVPNGNVNPAVPVNPGTPNVAPATPVVPVVPATPASEVTVTPTAVTSTDNTIPAAAVVANDAPAITTAALPAAPAVAQ